MHSHRQMKCSDNSFQRIHMVHRCINIDRHDIHETLFRRIYKINIVVVSLHQKDFMAWIESHIAKRHKNQANINHESKLTFPTLTNYKSSIEKCK